MFKFLHSLGRTSTVEKRHQPLTGSNSPSTCNVGFSSMCAQRVAYGQCLGPSVVWALHGAIEIEIWWLRAYGLKRGEDAVAKVLLRLGNSCVLTPHVSSWNSKGFWSAFKFLQDSYIYEVLFVVFKLFFFLGYPLQKVLCSTVRPSIPGNERVHCELLEMDLQ